MANEIVIKHGATIEEFRNTAEQELAKVEAQMLELENVAITDEDKRLTYGKIRTTNNQNIEVSNKEYKKIKAQVMEEIFAPIDSVVQALNTKRGEFVKQLDGMRDVYLDTANQIKKDQADAHLLWQLDMAGVEHTIKLEALRAYVPAEAYKFNTTESKTETLINNWVKDIKGEIDDFGIDLDTYYKYRFNSAIYAKSLVKDVPKTATKVETREPIVDPEATMFDKLNTKKTTQTTWRKHVDTKIVPEVLSVAKGAELTDDELLNLLRYIKREVSNELK